MSVRSLHLSLIVLATIVIPASLSWAIGFRLGQSKEQLKLDYDVVVKDHGTGRVTVVLTMADQGKLTPLTSVQLVIPDKEKNDTGGHYADLSVALAIREQSGKQVVRVHVLKELAERAEIQLRTRHLDGKQEALTSYYHVIPIAEYIKAGQEK